MGSLSCGIEPKVLHRVAGELKELLELNLQVAVVIGGGNLFRGKGLAEAGMDRVVGDHMGMLATVMNALAMQDALKQLNLSARVMSAVPIDPFCDPFSRREALNALDRGELLLFAAGTGNPFFTTDSAASLRAIEIGADILFKATKVDGVYDADPVKHPEAKRYDRLSYDEVIERRLEVMDTTAVVLCRDHQLPLQIFNLNEGRALVQAVLGVPIGTLVEAAKG